MPQAPSATEGVTLNLIPAGEGLPLAPSVCFICEGAPSNGAIDTFRTFMTQPPTHLTGRKYVCVDCATELGKLAGLEDASIADALRTTVHEQAARLGDAQLRVEQLEAVHVQTLKDLLDKAAKPAPKRAPAK